MLNSGIKNQKALSIELGVSESYIVKWKRDNYVTDEYRNKLNALAGIGSEKKSLTKTIPFYKSFKASAGFGAINGDVEEPEYIIMPGHFLPDASCQTEAIECSGDSMSPSINNGDTMFIDRADIEIKDGEIYVLRCQDELFVKRLFKMPGKIMARSDNATAGYGEFPLDMSNCQILGRVLYRMERV